MSYGLGEQPTSQSLVGKSSTFVIFLQKFPSFFLSLPQSFLIFVFILALKLGESAIREGNATDAGRWNYDYGNMY